MSNSDNPKNGAVFQMQVAQWFTEHYKKQFILEKKIPIGNPGKNHKFDIVDADNTMAIECKRFTWTSTGNTPSAKLHSANEAAFYLSFLPDTFEKIIVMSYAKHPMKKETLAEYYYRMNYHLLGKTKVAEYNPETKEMRFLF